MHILRRREMVDAGVSSEGQRRRQRLASETAGGERYAFLDTMLKTGHGMQPEYR